MKFISGQNVVDACIKGGQYSLLEYLIKDTKYGINKDKSKNDEIIKYTIKNSEDENYYWKSRKKKDITGNNSLHIAFDIKDLKLRYQFISLLIDEEIGDINKPNIMGLLPHELEHTQPLEDIPIDIINKFSWLKIENEEADYVIICKQLKKEIVVEQLMQMNLISKNSDLDLGYVR